ncbi:MAG: cache domain-containing protein [Firmicutes bacterium]|nr:cache domain-containing protein [Bacillota bacterium]
MRKFRSQKSIVTQTVFRVASIFIVALLTGIITFTCYIGNYMKNSILKSQCEQLDAIAVSLDGKLESLVKPIIVLAEYTPVNQVAKEYYADYSAEWMENIRSIDDYLQNVNMFTEYIVDINILNAELNGVYSLNNILRMDYDYGNQEWFQTAMNQEGLFKYAPPHGKNHLYRKNIGTTFSIIYPIKQSNIQIGYILIECDLLKIADFLDERQRDSGYVLTDEEGNIIFSYVNGTNSEKNILNYKKVKTGNSQSFFEKNMICVGRRLELNQWMIFLESDKNLILLPVKRLFLLIGVISFFTGVLLFW